MWSLVGQQDERKKVLCTKRVIKFFWVLGEHPVQRLNWGFSSVNQNEMVTSLFGEVRDEQGIEQLLLLFTYTSKSSLAASVSCISIYSKSMNPSSSEGVVL